MKNILVAFDFSKYSKKALETAVTFAKKTDGKIDLVHVDDQLIHAGVYADIHIPGYEESAKKFREELFERKVGECLGEMNVEGVQVDKHIMYGEPTHELLEFAKQHHNDMIIMGTKGTNLFSRLMIGGLAWNLMSSTHLPLLCVKDDFEINFKNILYAAELSKNENKTLEFLKYMDDVFKPHIEIGHVIGPETQLANEQEVSSVEKYHRLEKKMELAHQRALFKVEEVLKDWKFNDASTFVVETIYDSIGKILVKKIKEKSIDLVVLGSYSKSLWDRIVLGSTSEYIIKRSPKSFFIIPNEK